MLRTSMYTIYVDLPHGTDEILLVHGYSGAYDKVSRRVATYIRFLETSRPPKPLYGTWILEPAIEGEIPQISDRSIEILKKRGYLTEMSPEEEETFFSKVAVTLHHNSQRGVNYIVMPTYDCNLRCGYCFQDHMRTNSAYAHLLRTMRPEMVERMLMAMPRIEQGHGASPETQPNRNIGFFGGEPLLAQNQRIIEYIVRRAQEIGQATFWAVPMEPTWRPTAMSCGRARSSACRLRWTARRSSTTIAGSTPAARDRSPRSPGISRWCLSRACGLMCA